MVLDNTIKGKKDKKRRNLYYGMQRKMQQEQIALNNRDKHSVLFGTGQRATKIIPLNELLRKTADASYDAGKKQGARTRKENQMRRKARAEHVLMRNAPKKKKQQEDLEKPAEEKKQHMEDGVLYLQDEVVHSE